MSRTIWWHEDHPDLLDQTRLPFEEVVVHCQSPAILAEAIRALRVRGAPAIGVAAAYGVALAARQALAAPARFRQAVLDACTLLGATRPTAVNLFWALERMRGVLDAARDAPARQVAALLFDEASAIAAEDVAACRRMGEIGAELIRDGMGLLTHCNAGALATTGIGTATAPFYVAHEQGRHFHVYVDETRPLLQGARLTAWELHQAGVPFTLIADTMAAYTMRLGRINAVFVGADRIAANGDVANKIGTYGVALAAHAHGIPFYVVAPTSTIDPRTPTGAEIPIEERRPEEVRSAHGTPLTPDDYPVFNPAFDVTPAALVSAIITERGMVQAPHGESLRALIAGMTPVTDLAAAR
ncbi:MAG TPA: S-methyl-5-thioribose-1-phosphate isomerase [Chloroflexota bacterium]|nr:S-methyl-5-thioribose-1-phosphate isomerase [Chloroflexota bacterium]